MVNVECFCVYILYNILCNILLSTDFELIKYSLLIIIMWLYYNV